VRRGLYGYTAEEMIGKPLAILIPPGRKDEEASYSTVSGAAK